MNIFVASSSRSEARLNEVCAMLKGVQLNPIPWTSASAFGLGSATLKALLDISEQVDGAAFVFSGDDEILMHHAHEGEEASRALGTEPQTRRTSAALSDTQRNIGQVESTRASATSRTGGGESESLVSSKSDLAGHIINVTRDNVVLEYGLFMGKLGPKKCAIFSYGSTWIPTDLAGITIIKDGDPNIGTRVGDWEKCLLQGGGVQERFRLTHSEAVCIIEALADAGIDEVRTNTIMIHLGIEDVIVRNTLHKRAGRPKRRY